MSSKGITREQIEEIYLNTELTGREAAAKLGIGFRTFTAVLKRLGLKGKGRQANNPQLRDKDWLRQQYEIEGKSTHEIAAATGSTPGAIYSSLQWAGIPIRTSSEGLAVKYPGGRYGSAAANWRGGRRRAHGYVRIYIPTHPNHDGEGYVMEHRLVMEQYLGRLLDPLEEVHHINEIKDDNRIENLQVMSHRDHRSLHMTSQNKKRLQRVDEKAQQIEAERERLKALLEKHGIKD